MPHLGKSKVLNISLENVNTTEIKVYQRYVSHTIYRNEILTQLKLTQRKISKFVLLCETMLKHKNEYHR